MLFYLTDGPMAGAHYNLSRDNPSTTRKPDGLWFDGNDTDGRLVKHQYRESGKIDMQDGEIALQFVYDGAVEDVTTPGFCEHGVAEGDWCEPCNRAYKDAMGNPENLPS